MLVNKLNLSEVWLQTTSLQSLANVQNDPKQRGQQQPFACQKLVSLIQCRICIALFDLKEAAHTWSSQVIRIPSDQLVLLKR